MIKYRRGLDNYQFYNTPKEISYWTKVNEVKLQTAIDLFNEEIKWDGMWNVEDAKKRLEQGRLMVVLEIDDKLRGWYWLNYKTKEAENLYVHKDFRNKGYGFGLISYIITSAKLRQLDHVWARVDEWNKTSQRLFERCGFNDVGKIKESDG
tara:strand:- start:919 stop:1371 length:453 start_codon:yes stop_codon:yes gene_type:complete